MSELFEFTCDNCGMDVYYESGECAHDHCPQCRWSVHNTFGYKDEVPCGALMEPDEPFDMNGYSMMWLSCLGCGFRQFAPAGYIRQPFDFDFSWPFRVMNEHPRGFKTYLPKGAF
jgi:hypothetical protein